MYKTLNLVFIVFILFAVFFISPYILNWLILPGSNHPNAQYFKGEWFNKIKTTDASINLNKWSHYYGKHGCEPEPGTCPYSGPLGQWKLLSEFILEKESFPIECFSDTITEIQNHKIDSPDISEGYKIFYSFLKQNNFNSITNSGANASIKLPTDFNAIKNGVEIGEILKHRNELSKQNNYDFSNYMGKQVSIYTAEIKGVNNDTFHVVLLLSENKIIGYWIDPGKKDSKQRRTDFILTSKTVRS